MHLFESFRFDNGDSSNFARKIAIKKYYTDHTTSDACPLLVSSTTFYIVMTRSRYTK